MSNSANPTNESKPASNMFFKLIVVLLLAAIVGISGYHDFYQEPTQHLDSLNLQKNQSEIIQKQLELQEKVARCEFNKTITGSKVSDGPFTFCNF